MRQTAREKTVRRPCPVAADGAACARHGAVVLCISVAAKVARSVD